MLHISRTVVWLGGLALIIWGCAAVLVGFQMAGHVPAPCGGFVGLIAATLTTATVQIAKREPTAVRVEPVPLSVALGVEPDTVAMTLRTRPTAPQQRFATWDTAQCGPQSWTRVYNSSVIGGGYEECNEGLTGGARAATIIEFGRRIERAHPIAEI